MKTSLLMPFIDESEEFVHGFECGQVWEKLNAGGSLVGYLIHTENSAQVQMICDYYRVSCKIEVHKDDSTWSCLTTAEEGATDFLNDIET